jgi:teichuronic acid biosynthesis glycosyltransferase TuaH
MKSILYLMHVPWGWIKQRPHFIAENLAGSYNVTVCYKKAYRTKLLTGESHPAETPFWELFALPFSRLAGVGFFTKILIRRQISTRIQTFDIIWVTHPTMFDYIEDIISPEMHLVYDCMDDVLEFPAVKGDPGKSTRLKDLEGRLLARANTVFVSSVYLKRIMSERHGAGKVMVVLNNGIDQNRLGPQTGKCLPDFIGKIEAIRLTKIMYIGTIAGWVDFDLILRSLEDRDDIVYLFIGPLDTVAPRHDRIIILPPVEHSQVFNLMQLADILVMPFVVTDLIKSVNPVKVYEYIASGKPSLVVEYSETLQFGHFVTLYRDCNDYIEKLRWLIADTTQSNEDSLSKAHDFIANNTWEIRTVDIRNILQQAP